MPTSFAYDLLLWIRANKKEIYGSLLPEGTNERDTVRYKCLIQTMASFDRQYRGAQDWLANLAGPKVPAGYRTNLQYGIDAVVIALLEAKRTLTAPVWSSLLAMSTVDSRTITSVSIRYGLGNKLHDIVKPYKGASFELKRSPVVAVELKLSRKSATNFFTRAFPIPDIEGQTLDEQLTAIEQYWRNARDYVLEVLSEAKNWPNDQEIWTEELRQLESMARSMMRGLSLSQQKLAREHPEAFWKCIKAHL